MRTKQFVFAVAAVVLLAAVSLQAKDDALETAVAVETAFANVVDASKEAVVIITNKQSTIVSRAMDRMPEEFFEFFNFPRQREPQQDRQGPVRPAGRGSGFFISKNGHIVTNYHVIRDAEYLEVKTSDGSVYDNQKDADAVKVIGYDEESDLAVLQISDKKRTSWPVLRFADSDKLRVGQWAIAIGAPFNLDYSVTIGCVSQKGRTDMGMSTFDSYIQTDASINPGNSGGPLLNIRGEVIGVNQFIVTGGGASRGSVGVGFAITSNFAKQITEDLIENGEISRPFLGISMQDLNPAMKEEFGLESGVLVREVIKDQAAEKAGIKAGDVIVSVSGVKVSTSHELLMEVAKHKPGETIDVTLKRDGKEMVIPVKAGKRDDFIAKNGGVRKNPRVGDRSISKLGLRLVEDKGRVIVRQVIPGGAAEKAGEANEDRILQGDVILEINRVQIKSIADVRRVLGELRKNTVIAYMERRGQGSSYKYFIAIDLGK